LIRGAVNDRGGLLADALIELYVDWREECHSVQTAYERWIGAGREDRAEAFAVYGAALDREERAGERYAELIRRAGTAARQSG
jgi:hypothetical protein